MVFDSKSSKEKDKKRAEENGLFSFSEFLEEIIKHNKELADKMRKEEKEEEN